MNESFMQRSKYAIEKLLSGADPLNHEAMSDIACYLDLEKNRFDPGVRQLIEEAVLKLHAAAHAVNNGRTQLGVDRLMSEETWSCETEGLISLFASVDEAVDDYLCYAEPTQDSVSVYRYRLVEPTPQDCGSPLEYILERLDEEYLPDELTPDSPTQTMLDAEREFIKIVLSEYRGAKLQVVETRQENLGALPTNSND